MIQAPHLRRTEGMRYAHAMVAALLAVPLIAAGPAPATVHIRNYAFVPVTLTVKAGTTVRFVNDDSDVHTATADDQSWDSGGLDTGNDFTHTFAKPGRVAYRCSLHPMMKATIVVTK